MLEGELDDDALPHAFHGFRSNADDTPRTPGPVARYEDRCRETEPTFSAAAASQDALSVQSRESLHAPAPPFRQLRPKASVALLVLLAIGAGFALTRGWTSIAPASSQQAPTKTLRVEIAPVPAGTAAAVAPAAAAPVGLLAAPEPVQPDRAAWVPRAPSAPRAAMAAAPSPRLRDPQVSSNASASTPAPVAPAPLVGQAAAPSIRPAFDCQSDGLTQAQQMVCGDPRLAAADQRLSHAYAAALAAGGPIDQLRSEQADWLSIREDAARYSKRAVLNIYEQRTRELEALVEDPPE